MTRHPAKYNDKLLPVFEEMMKGCHVVLDPFAGTGKIHSLPFETVGVEIEREWASMHEGTIVGDATNLPFSDNSFDAICTSPTYGNRMADCHNAKDGSKRNTYTHCIGHPLHDKNTGKMQWGVSYRRLHKQAWEEAFRVLKPNGILVLNMKNHIRNGKEVDVFSWHLRILLNIGFEVNEIRHVECKGNGFGKNNNARSQLLLPKGKELVIPDNLPRKIATTTFLASSSALPGELHKRKFPWKPRYFSIFFFPCLLYSTKRSYLVRKCFHIADRHKLYL